jgi:hypothetical protein
VTHGALSLAYLLTRAALFAAGFPFVFSLDWMWMADPVDLRDRLLATVTYFHAFPPGMNLLTGALLKAGGIAHAGTVAQVMFLALGVVQVNALMYLGRAVGLSGLVAASLALAFSVTPAAIYFDHLYLYEWPVTTLLVVAAVLFHRAVRSGHAWSWFTCFGVCALIGLTRSTFHLAWFALVVAGSCWLSSSGRWRPVLRGAWAPGLLLAAVYAKNAVLFGAFAISTFGPASFHLVTVDRLPREVRDTWIREGRLSPFAAISAYASPRTYAPHFGSADLAGWPPTVTRLQHATVNAPNFNHWFLLKVHEARRRDVQVALTARPLDYVRSVGAGLRAFSSPSTGWHPRSRTPASPHLAHRAVLGRYDAWYTRAVHGFPWPPVGLYAFVPLVCLFHAWRLRQRAQDADPARAALLGFCLFLVVYTTAASTMLTYFESSRYRFQIEPFLWLLTAVAVQSLIRSVRARWTST